MQFPLLGLTLVDRFPTTTATLALRLVGHCDTGDGSDTVLDGAMSAASERCQLPLKGGEGRIAWRGQGLMYHLIRKMVGVERSTDRNLLAMKGEL